MIKGNYKVIALISRLKLETSVIPLFCVILPEISFSGKLLVILDDHLGQKVNFIVNYDFNISATN